MKSMLLGFDIIVTSLFSLFQTEVTRITFVPFKCTWVLAQKKKKNKFASEINFSPQVVLTRNEVSIFCMKLSDAIINTRYEKLGKN